MDPAEPVHIDALLAWAMAPLLKLPTCTSRSDIPDDIPLPLAQWRIGDTWGWRASALIPDGPQANGLEFWRKKFRVNRIEWTRGSPNLTNGTYREHNAPMPLILCHRLIGYAVGDRSDVKHALKRVRYIGKKRACGKGAVVAIDVDYTDVDGSCVLDGRAMRYLPHPEGVRMVRPRPPYWHPHGAVPCGEIGEPRDIEEITHG